MELLPYLAILLLLTSTTYVANKFYSEKTMTLNDGVKYQYNSKGKLILSSGYIVFILFATFRVIDVGVGGIDAMGYKQYFLGSDGTWLEALKYQNYEPGYGSIIWLLRQFTDDYKVVLFFIYTVLVILLAQYSKYMTWNIYSVLSIFLLSAMLINSFNTLRVIVAVFIGLMVFISLYHNKYKWSILIALFAVSIHISALILLPVILIYYMVNKRTTFSFKWLVVYIGSMALMATLVLQIGLPLISGSKYHIYGNDQGIALQTYIIIFLVFIFSVIKYEKMIEVNPFNKTLITILPIGLVVLPLQMEFSILYRMLLYFLPIIYTLIPSLIKVYSITSKKWIYYYPIQLGLLFYLLGKVYIFFTVEIESAGLPYISIFFNAN